MQQGPFGGDYRAALRLGRALRGLSQRQLAELVGAKPWRVNRLELGLATPRLGELQQLYAALYGPGAPVLSVPESEHPREGGV